MKSIFLHGLGQNASHWDRTVCNIKSELEVICPDLPDLLCGREVTYHNLYESFVEYCGGFSAPFHICGLSLGGILALQYAIEHPSKVSSIALIGAQFSMPKKLLKFQNLLFRFMPGRMFGQVGFGKKDFIRLSRSMMNLGFQQDLKNIACPVLVICGENDKANRQASLELSEQVPRAKMKFIENAGHEVNIDAPEKLGEILDCFFSGGMDF